MKLKERLYRPGYCMHTLSGGFREKSCCRCDRRFLDVTLVSTHEGHSRTLGDSWWIQDEGGTDNIAKMVSEENHWLLSDKMNSIFSNGPLAKELSVPA